MGYVLVNEDLKSLNTRIKNNSEQNGESFEKLTSAADFFVHCRGYEGNRANNIKKYIENTYETTNNLFAAIATALLVKYSAYSHKYQTDVDSHYSAEVSTDALAEMAKEIAKRKNDLQSVKTSFLRIQGDLQRNGDLMTSVRLNRLDESMNKLDTVVKELERLQATFVQIEESDIKSEFTNIDTMMTKLEGLLDYQLGLNPTDSFDVMAYRQKLGEAGEAYVAMVTEVSSLQEVASAAQQQYGQMEVDKLEDERKEREKKAAFWGFIVDAVCVVATVAATATLGPVGAIAVGAVTGLAKSAIHEGLDQWAATGASLGELDWGRIAIKGAIGGISGAATAAIGGAFNGVGTTFLGKTAAAIGKNVTSKLVDKGLQGVETTALALHEGKSLSEATSAGWDTFKKDLGKDMLHAVASGATSQITGSITGKMGDGWKKNLTEIGSNAVVSTLNYGVDCAIDGKEFDWKEAGKAAAKSGVHTVIDQASSWAKNDFLQADKYAHSVDSDFKAVAVTYVIGSADKYLTGAAGGFVDSLIEGKSIGEAAESFRLVDDEGKPTSALMDLTTGGAKDAANVYYDRNLSAKLEPKVIKTEPEKIIGEDGKVLITYKEEIITNDGQGHKIVQERVYTREEGSEDVKVDITVHQKSNLNFWGDGKEIGSGSGSTKVVDMPGMEWKETRTEENLTYKTADGKTHTSSSSSTTTMYQGDVVRDDSESTETVMDKKGREESYDHSKTTGMAHTSSTEETSRRTDYKQGTTSTTEKHTMQEGRNESGGFNKSETETTTKTADTRGANKGAYSTEKSTVTTEKVNGTTTTTTTSSKDSGHTGKDFQHTESKTTTTADGNTTRTESSSYTASGKENAVTGKDQIKERVTTSSSSETTKTGDQTVTESHSETNRETLKNGNVKGTEHTEANDKTTTTAQGEDRTYTERSSDSTTETTKGTRTTTHTTVSESRTDTYKTSDGNTHAVNRTDSATETAKNGEVKKTEFSRTNASSVTTEKDHVTQTLERTSTAKSPEADYGKPKAGYKEEYDVQYKSDHKEVGGRISTNAGIAKYKQGAESKAHYEKVTTEETEAIKEKYSVNFNMKSAEEMGLPVS